MAKKLPAKGKGKGNRFERWLVAGIVVSVIVIGLVLWGPLRTFRSVAPKKPAAPPAVQQEPGPSAGSKAAAKKPHAQPAAKDHPKYSSGPALLGSAPSEKTVQIAIVIDDLGMDARQAREILSLPAKITLAVIPGLAQSKAIAELATKSKHEVLIHLPMEYHGKNGKPAAGMLRSNMTPMEFLTTVSDDVESVPGAVGINNHEGSALTENRDAMKFLMAELKARNLMFLDSLTSPRSVAYSTAREFGLRSGKRDVFLDNDSDNPSAIDRQFEELVEIARKNGRAIGIGHPHPATIAELRKWITQAQTGRSIEIVPVSRLLN